MKITGRMRLFRMAAPPRIRKGLFFIILTSAMGLWLISSRLSATQEDEKDVAIYSSSHKEQTARQGTTYIHKPHNRHPLHEISSDGNHVVSSDSAALVFFEEEDKDFGNQILVALDSNRFKMKVVKLLSQELPLLTRSGVGLYSVIIFQSIHTYLSLRSEDRNIIDSYCREFGVGLLTFVLSSSNSQYSSQVGDFPLVMDQKLTLKDLSFNVNSPVFHITKTEHPIKGILPGDDWTVFRTNHSTYQPITEAKTSTQDMVPLMPDMTPVLHPTVLHDQGLFDGVQRIFFGSDFRLWLHYILFLDCVRYLSNQRLSVSLQRYILVDIDDIFVGSEGIRMTPEDVDALILEQDILSELVPGFHFNLGFSGKFFKHGNKEENDGDERLLKHADKFWWFPHMWNHMQPHKYKKYDNLAEDMKLNKKFAEDHWIPVKQGYAVAPHHSGVYPVYANLYKAWKAVWNIEATSTEEYPHLHPSRNRRGFIHDNIMVAPRQTCGLFTHTNYFKDYPGGKQRLVGSIHGGELFKTLVNNPVNIFMTHLSNYGNDRLAMYTFDKLVHFVQSYTNFQLISLTPVETIKKYFEIFPKERDPVWGNPCDDKRHLEIWPVSKSCSQVPQLIVVGPQKTGTTALYQFLTVHPYVQSNKPSEKTFEELQFFSGANYYKGVDWYMSFFPKPKNSSQNERYLFEKSATYFDSSVAAQRARAILPKAKIIAIFIHPGNRSYSWYQHMRSHNDPVALNNSFYDIITADNNAPRAIRSLKNRCLEPGKYSTHLTRWLKYFPRQVLVLDGDVLRDDPVSIMSEVQRFLGIRPRLDYKHFLTFDEEKGFFCISTHNGNNECLGKSKGRAYPPMDARSAEYLSIFYKQHNMELHNLLQTSSQVIPQWLKEDVGDVP